MSLIDEIKAIKTRITTILSAITGFENSAGPHPILSATHNDSTPAAVQRGDLIVGGIGPVWVRLPAGADGEVLQSDGLDLLFGDLAWTHIDKAGSNLTDLATRNHNDLQNIGADDHHAKVHTLDSTIHHSAATDNTDHDVTKDIHGLCPKLPDDELKYLNGKGQFTTPATGGGGGTFTLYDPDYFPASPTSQSDHFDDASIDGKWTEIDPGNKLTLTESLHHLKFNVATSSGWAGVWQTLPAGDFTITAKIRYEVAYNGSNYFNFGIILFDDASANPNTSDWLSWTFFTYGLTLGFQITRYSAYASWSATPYSSSGNVIQYLAPAIYLRVRRNGTTWYFDSSLNGLSWIQVTSLNQASYYNPPQFGLGCWQNTGVTHNGYVDWCYYLGSDSFLAPGRVRTVALG
jgi:hypothetical protein